MRETTPLLRAAVKDLYGRDMLDDLATAAGTLLVVAVHEDSVGRWRTLRIEAATPSHSRDRFALGLARARADAIVVSGAVLRAEPTLSYSLWEPGSFRQELLDFRAVQGASPAPQLWIYTQHDVDLSHPALHGWPNPVRYMPPHSNAAPSAENFDLRDVVRIAKREHLRTLTLECGPRSCAPLFLEPLQIDEIMISVVRGPVSPALLLDSPLQPALLERAFELVAGDLAAVQADTTRGDSKVLTAETAGGRASREVATAGDAPCQWSFAWLRARPSMEVKR